MNTPVYSQNVMESAVEIAYVAGHYGFKTPDSRDMMSQFVTWAEEFEAKPYVVDDWLQLIQEYATERLVIEVEHGRARFDGDKHLHLPSIRNLCSSDEWKTLPDYQWVYLPDFGDRILKKADFVQLCQGNVDRAHRLLEMCNWQHPQTVIDEAGGLDALFADSDAPVSA